MKKLVNALRLLESLDTEKPMSLEEAAAAAGSYAEQLKSQMAHLGLIDAKRGPGGGCVRGSGFAAANLGELVVALSGGPSSPEEQAICALMEEFTLNRVIALARQISHVAMKSQKRSDKYLPDRTDLAA